MLRFPSNDLFLGIFLVPEIFHPPREVLVATDPRIVGNPQVVSTIPSLPDSLDSGGRVVGALVDSYYLRRIPENRGEDRSIVRASSSRFVLQRERTRHHSSRSRRNMLTARESRCVASRRANRRRECLPIDDNANFHDCSPRFRSLRSPTYDFLRWVHQLPNCAPNNGYPFVWMRVKCTWSRGTFLRRVWIVFAWPRGARDVKYD